MRIRVRVVGDRNTQHLTHREIDAALRLFPADVEARWLATGDRRLRDLSEIDGAWVAPGSPYRDDDAVLDLLGRARTGRLPLLATCGGFQYALLEFARNVAMLRDAANAELTPDAPDPLVMPLACSLFGEIRRVIPVAGTRLAAATGAEPFDAFHWCGYGLNPAYVDRLTEAGLVVCARADDAGVEGVELADHPFFVATLFQPQVGSSRGGPLHPLLGSFLGAARRHASGRAARRAAN